MIVCEYLCTVLLESVKISIVVYDRMTINDIMKVII